MTHALCCLLSPEGQLRYTLARGTYLAQRCEQASAVMLHHVPDGGRGFFIKPGTEEEQTHFFVRRSFSEASPLADYAQGVHLPQW